ncbi:NADPH-dependent glutamate synthase [Oceanirhabdus seepicola]|uniref:NADPH-dependent glutamate synthase n=1 Tax=Oceanirhabdus seepicola TaxID=2828781 RepID=A0A9J6P263_9CLOT|nr:NADPH-dependent glutamate synthase [Oceanirhabdus seepicola]MCM1990153.1 NADPH-dependent glutamate synthase [Oceanirhabdus seepicola]
MILERIKVREQDPKVRSTNFEEVCLGYNEAEAVEEAKRCLGCKSKPCVSKCPVAIDIPEFIKYIKEENFEMASEELFKHTSLGAVCGRVCPQEVQCESKCVLSHKGEAVAIGKLERFVADWHRKNKPASTTVRENSGKKVAVIGSGPAGLSCAGDLAKKGFDVTVFEALHELGGVLTYGIPEFRLPKEIVKHEINNLKSIGVKFEKNVVFGRTINFQSLEEEGFESLFIASGAGLPKFLGIEGEGLNGVFSANEFLTRANLMRAFDDEYETPMQIGNKVAVVGGGNVAMDAARTALRLGAEVYLIYRRTEKELPARVEEVHHAKEEGVKFVFLTNPAEITGEDGWVKGVKCTKMQLGEPDDSGRCRVSTIEGSEHIIEVDSVIMALGTRANPIITELKNDLELNEWNNIKVFNDNGKTSAKNTYAGGDAVTGAATVILAMGAGRKSAQEIANNLA